MASDLAADAPRRSSRIRRPRLWTVLLAVGIASIVVGGAIIAGPVIGVFQRGASDSSALKGWNGSHPGVTGANPDAPKTLSCGSSSAADYALVTFGAPVQYHYSAVAGNGTWTLLNSRSMVHYAGTPNPGQQGNVIIAFHREPDFQYINQLNVGATITIQSRTCQTYVYKVTARWDLSPSKVTQLAPTSGHELTMVTCDPWWQDYNRLVWRAELISAPATGGSTGGSVANPAF
ncbi:MAG: class E sortase [Candidatus Dormiibacterota bacterium]